MKLHLIVEDPDPAFQKALLALLAGHASSLKTAGPATDWADPETASRYYLSLPTTAQRILREASAREDGYVPADVLRGPNGDGKLTGSSGAFKAALKRGVRRNWWIAGQVSPVLAEGPGFGKVAGYRIRNDALPAFQAAVTSHQQGELASQKDCLAEAITAEGGEWDAQRSVAALHEIGHTIDEKRARQILRDLAADGVIDRVDADRAIYRPTVDPEQ
ncbi:hypothetical protein AB0469_38035 [Streptomyces sp. NPDC093801]|uniref:hypothetical protein n=1 Tax=Streptomyces sp. NPDC093801 TaxID=3155203 RepID=UPI00344C2221